MIFRLAQFFWVSIAPFVNGNSTFNKCKISFQTSLQNIPSCIPMGIRIAINTKVFLRTTLKLLSGTKTLTKRVVIK